MSKMILFLILTESFLCSDNGIDSESYLIKPNGKATHKQTLSVIPGAVMRDLEEVD